MAEPTQRVALPDAFHVASARLGELCLTPQTLRALDKGWTRLRHFAESDGACRAIDVDAALAAAFVHARDARGREPSVAAMHWRRSSIRLVFRIWRDLELVVGDPTIDLALPPRSGLPTRPLTDDEVALCRWSSLGTVGPTRLPAVWALAEAGATSGEMPLIRGCDVDIEASEVAIPGSTKTDARVAPLTEWGATQLARRMNALEQRRAMPVVYEGAGKAESGQASASGAIGDVLRRAGLADDPNVRRARSPRGWVERCSRSRAGSSSSPGAWECDHSTALRR